jgi:hypothetical protein
LITNPAKVASVKVISLQSTFLQRLRDAALKDNHCLKIRKALDDRKNGLDLTLSLSEELVFFKNRWCVPEGRDLRQEIVSQNHDSMIAGNLRQFKTAEKIKVNFYWHNIDQDI